MVPEGQFKRPAYLDAETLHHFLDFLIDLRAKSDPAHGQSSKVEKHYNAQQALYFTGLLTESLCGWAADHIAGTLKEKFTKVPSIGAADDHRFEQIGHDYEPGQTETDRELLAKLISAGGFVPSRFRGPLQNALHALDSGEVLDLVRPAEKGLWGSHTPWPNCGCWLSATFFSDGVVKGRERRSRQWRTWRKFSQSAEQHCGPGKPLGCPRSTVPPLRQSMR